MIANVFTDEERNALEAAAEKALRTTWTCDLCGESRADTDAQYIAKGARAITYPAPGYPRETNTVAQDGTACACCAGECSDVGGCERCDERAEDKRIERAEDARDYARRDEGY